MKLMIDITEETYHRCCAIAELDGLPILIAIKNGTPLEDMPSTEKTGRWIAIDEKPHEDYECGNCGYVVSIWTEWIEPHKEYKFCPNCGCRMIGGE